MSKRKANEIYKMPDNHNNSEIKKRKCSIEHEQNNQISSLGKNFSSSTSISSSDSGNISENFTEDLNTSKKSAVLSQKISSLESDIQAVDFLEDYQPSYFDFNLSPIEIKKTTEDSKVKDLVTKFSKNNESSPERRLTSLRKSRKVARTPAFKHPSSPMIKPKSSLVKNSS